MFDIDGNRDHVDSPSLREWHLRHAPTTSWATPTFHSGNIIHSKHSIFNIDTQKYTEMGVLDLLVPKIRWKMVVFGLKPHRSNSLPPQTTCCLHVPPVDQFRTIHVVFKSSRAQKIRDRCKTQHFGQASQTRMTCAMMLDVTSLTWSYSRPVTASPRGLIELMHATMQKKCTKYMQHLIWQQQTTPTMDSDTGSPQINAI
jgi:hypothetical protein